MDYLLFFRLDLFISLPKNTNNFQQEYFRFIPLLTASNCFITYAEVTVN